MAAAIWSIISGRRASEKLGMHSMSWGMGFSIYDFGFAICDLGFTISESNYKR
jgi:hypothetical protein